MPSSSSEGAIGDLSRSARTRHAFGFSSFGIDAELAGAAFEVQTVDFFAVPSEADGRDGLPHLLGGGRTETGFLPHSDCERCGEGGMPRVL